MPYFVKGAGEIGVPLMMIGIIRCFHAGVSAKVIVGLEFAE